MEIYLVGGAIRDQLLNRPVTERDWVVVGATPERMLALGYRPVGEAFPVFLHPETGEEYALARAERKIGPGYRGFTCQATPDITLEEDLLRRDLTINAMAMAQNLRGEIIDPYGGQKDLKQRVLRHVSPAFVEDPVRSLRVARFAARYHHLGFKVADETNALLKSMVENNEINHLVAERVWQELRGALAENAPAQFFTVLQACGALGVIFPEIAQLYGVPQSEKWHPEIDTGVHTMMALTQAARLTESPVVRFAALVHDLGKGKTLPALWPEHSGHEEAGLEPIKAMCQRLRIPAVFSDLAKIASLYHTHCHKVQELTPDIIVQTLEKLDAFRRSERFKEFLLVCEADSRGRLGYEESPYPQADYFLRAYEAAASISIQPLLDRGLAQASLGQAVHEERVRVVALALGLYKA